MSHSALLLLGVSPDATPIGERLAAWNREMARLFPTDPGPALTLLRDPGVRPVTPFDDEEPEESDDDLHARLLLEGLPGRARERAGHWLEVEHAGLAYVPTYRHGRPLQMINRVEILEELTGGAVWLGGDHRPRLDALTPHLKQHLWADALVSGYSAPTERPRLAALLGAFTDPTEAERENIGTALDLYRSACDGGEEAALYSRARRLLPRYDDWEAYQGAVLGI